MTAFRIALVAGVVFAAVLAWDAIIVHPRVGGTRIAGMDQETAKYFEVDRPEIMYIQERGTTRFVPVPATMAFGAIVRNVFRFKHYDRIGTAALTLAYTTDGQIASVSLLVALTALLVGGIRRFRARRKKKPAGE